MERLRELTPEALISLSIPEQQQIDFHQEIDEIIAAVTSSSDVSQTQPESDADIVAPLSYTHVVHTSTIPLGNVVNVFKMRHAQSIRHVEDCTQCMCGRTGQDVNRPFPLSNSCPCLDIEQDDDIDEICFNNFLKNSYIRVSTRDKEIIPTIDPKRVFFCKDGQNIFSDSYGRVLREDTGITGWNNARTPEDLEKVLLMTYWFKHAMKNQKFSRAIGKHFKEGKNFQRLKKAVKQAIYLANGLIIKIILINRDFNYHVIAEATANCFKGQLDEQLAEPERFQGRYVEPREEDSMFKTLKNGLAFFKERYLSMKRETRLEALSFKPKGKLQAYCSLHSMVLNVMRRRIEIFQIKQGVDFTLTLQWKIDGALLCQTRGMCYLPKIIAEAKAEQYRLDLEREPIKISTDHRNAIACALSAHLERDVPEDIYTHLYEPNIPDLIEGIFSEVEFDVKNTASFRTKLSEGGKLEDTRRFFNYCKDRDIELNIYDLWSGTKRTSFRPKIDELSYSKFLFWFSFQQALNFLYRRLKSMGLPDKDNPYVDHYKPMIGLNEEEFNYARILHINEPGKQRNLVKGTTQYNSFLALGGKMFQLALAKSPEHAIGLTSTSDGWKLLQRIHPERGAANFFTKDGNYYTRAKPMYAFYTDWTESTDFIEKEIGIAALCWFRQHIGFPNFYFGMIRMILRLEQIVKETVVITDDDVTTVEYKGFIRNGFMMGNPITKTILHLQHSIELGGAMVELAKRGITLVTANTAVKTSDDRVNQFMHYINNPS